MFNLLTFNLLKFLSRTDTWYVILLVSLLHYYALWKRTILFDNDNVEYNFNGRPKLWFILFKAVWHNMEMVCLYWRMCLSTLLARLIKRQTTNSYFLSSKKARLLLWYKAITIWNVGFSQFCNLYCISKPTHSKISCLWTTWFVLFW